jgi:ferredoxin
MATIIINNNSHPIPDGAAIRSICASYGVAFDCGTGVCGSCEIEVIEGAEHLNPVQPEETNLGLGQNRRLACLCIIKSGTVKIKTL